MPSEPDVVMTPAPKRFGKALRHHRRQDDRADRDHRRGRRSGHRGKQRAGEHAGKRQAAVPMADHGGRESDHAARDAAMGEEIAGQDEERDRHDLEALEPGEQLERDRFRAHVGQREHEGEHGEAERDRYRHAGEHQRDQQDEHDDGAQALRQHDETGGMRDADRHDQKRHQDQDQAERAACPALRASAGPVVGRVRAASLRRPRHARRRDAAVRRSR